MDGVMAEIASGRPVADGAEDSPERLLRLDTHTKSSWDAAKAMTSIISESYFLRNAATKPIS
jgi:hypothetical protein